MGGGFLLTPGLNILFQMPAPLAVGTSLCQMIGTATAAVRRHLKLGNVDVKLSLMVMGGALGGVPLGSWAVNSLKDFGQYVIFGRMVPVVEFVIRVAYLVLLLVMAVLIYREAHQASLGLRVTGGPWRGARLRIGPMVRFYGTGDQPVSLFFCCIFVTGNWLLIGAFGIRGKRIAHTGIDLFAGNFDTSSSGYKSPTNNIYRSLRHCIQGVGRGRSLGCRSTHSRGVHGGFTIGRGPSRENGSKPYSQVFWADASGGDAYYTLRHHLFGAGSDRLRRSLFPGLTLTITRKRNQDVFPRRN